MHGAGRLYKHLKFVLPNCASPKSSHQTTGTPRSLLLSLLHLPLSHNHPLTASDSRLIMSDVNDKRDYKSWDLMRSLNTSQPASKICFIQLPSRQNRDKTLSHSCSGYFRTCRKHDFGRAYVALRISYGVHFCSSPLSLRGLVSSFFASYSAQELLT